MYKIMLREAPATRLDQEKWTFLMNPDETAWSTDSVEELDEKLKETLLNVSKNNILVVTQVDWEVLIEHPEPEEPTPPTDPTTPTDPSAGGGANV